MKTTSLVFHLTWVLPLFGYQDSYKVKNLKGQAYTGNSQNGNQYHNTQNESQSDRQTRSDQNGEEFDYIVVGAGPTGSMTAMGLAEGGYKTLLIDAGQDHMSANITTPTFHVRASEDANIAWDFHVRHYDAKSKLRQKVLYPRVAGLGGCTLHNAMIHILPNKEDFQKMVKLTGDPSWSEENMRRYYNKIVRPTFLERMAPMRAMNQMGTTFQNISRSITDRLSDHKEGWLKLSTVDLFNLLSNDPKLLDLSTQILPKALISDILGFDINAYDANGDVSIDKEKTFLVPMNSDVSSGHKRKGIYERLKEVHSKSDKLTIWTNTLATKIILENKPLEAKGIEYLKGKFLYKAGKRVNVRSGIPGKVFAKREVIISAGTFNTPQLMMLSGVGDPEQLEEFGIKPKVNLPGVGKNLHDRYEVALNAKFDKPFTLTDGCTFVADNSDPCFKNYVETASGPYTFNGILTGTTIKSSPTLTSPDLFMLVTPILFNGYHEGMGQEVVDNKDMFTMLLLKAHTSNHRGEVRLLSKDPTDVPDINFRYFSENADKDLPPIIKGIRDARKILSKFTNGFVETSPGPKVQSDKDLAEYIVNTAWGHHATGTMKIGKDAGDALAVLDGKFRVKGVKNLRVADMSIFPEIPGYFPVLYLYCVGAKAADVILADAKNSALGGY